MKLKVTSGKEMPILSLYGVIGPYDGISVDDVRAALADIPDTQAIEVRVNSPGGSFPESIAIYSNFVRRKGDTHMVVDSEAHSGASIIVQAGKTISMNMGSWMMIHEANGQMSGRAEDFRQAAERLDTVNDQIMQIYKPRWKGSENELRAALNKEFWMCDADAVKMGMADCVNNTMAIAACADLTKFGYHNIPEVLVKSVPQSTLEREKLLQEMNI